jgi:diguanylate cyclase (GGDEF)-like protein
MGVLRLLLRFLALALLGWAAAAHAAVPVESCLVRLTGAPDEEARLLATPERFDCSSDQTRLGPGNFLAQLRFAPQRAEPGDPLVLRQTSIWQDRAQYAFHYADGTVAKLDLTSSGSSRYLTIGAIFEFPVPYRAAALTGVSIRTTDTANLRGVVLGARIARQSETFAIRARLTALYAGFAGLAIALIAYNFSLWVALRHRFQLYYCAMVAALGAYTFTASGAVMIALPWLANNDRLRANYVLLALSGVLALQFICSFFGRQIIARPWLIAARICSGAALVAALAFAVLSPWQSHLLDRLYFAGMVSILCMVVPVMACAWRARSRYFWLFLLAWIAPLFTSVLRAAHGFNLIEYNFLLDNGNAIALTIEALLSSILVTARLRDLSNERDDARLSEQTAMRLANTDPLTGLLNRRAFLDLAIGRPGRFRLMLIDIDRFKDINDRLGHDGGDEVLREVAKAIQAIRPADSLAVRLGGEEFALLVPDLPEPLCPPEQLLQKVRGQKMPLGTRVTVSLGYAEGEIADEQGWKKLYRLADTALYRAKADGRDRACRATDFASKRPSAAQA